MNSKQIRRYFPTKQSKVEHFYGDTFGDSSEWPKCASEVKPKLPAKRTISNGCNALSIKLFKDQNIKTENSNDYDYCDDAPNFGTFIPTKLTKDKINQIESEAEEDSKYGSSCVEDYSSDYIQSFPKLKRKRIGSFADPDFINSEEENTLKDSNTSDIHSLKRINSNKKKYAVKNSQSFKISSDRIFPSKEQLESLFCLPTANGRQDLISTEDTPCFDN